MKAYKGIITVLTLLIISSFLIMFNCTKKTEKQFIIGAILPMTGPVSLFGEWHKNGMELAIEEINSQSENKFKIMYGDSKNNTKEGVALMNKFTSVRLTFTSPFPFKAWIAFLKRFIII